MSSEDMVDFNRSSFTWSGERRETEARFALDAVCVMRDRSTAAAAVYALGSAVVAARVYATERMVMEPHYFFQVAVSNKNHVMLRTFLRHRDKADSVSSNSGKFRDLDLHIVRGPATRVADYGVLESVFDAHAVMSARLHLNRDDRTSLELEFPVRHINLRRSDRKFQVETGPVLFPAEIPDDWAERDSIPVFRTAYVHFNRLDSAEITVCEPKRVGLRRTRFPSRTMAVPAEITMAAHV
jgi:hypothetical protein